MHGGPAAFYTRFVLAATLSPSYGIYSGYEHYENVPVREGSEEYLDSEKYEIKQRALDGPMLPFIARVNQIRRENPALQHLSDVAWLETQNDQLMAYVKQYAGNAVICVVNLDPHHAQEGSAIDPGAPRPAARVRRHRPALGRALRLAHRAELRAAGPVDAPGAHPAGRVLMSDPGHWFEAEPLWFKTAVFYEIHIRGFFDGNGDGSGDFRGLTEKLDYLQWLGVDCIWLLPFYKSPLRDGGYDISDYFQIHPDYGVVEDVRDFIEQAHQRGIRVIADLVMNHTSSDHPWFQESRSSPDNPKRDWYVWSDTVHRYEDARIIFVDTETSNWTWDDQAGAYFWHRFFSHQPDLNFDNPEVQDAMLEVLRFWLDLGLDGCRLDAVPVPVRARGHDLREPARDARLPQARAGRDRRQLPRPRAARRGQPVAGRRRRLLRRRRRVPDVLPLPGDAAHVHERAPGGGQADVRDPRPDAGDPGQLPVGPVPAQPRRADARDGHRRGARLHVHGVRQGPAHEDQRRASAGGSRRCSTTAATRSS